MPCQCPNPRPEVRCQTHPFFCLGCEQVLPATHPLVTETRRVLQHAASYHRDLAQVLRVARHLNQSLTHKQWCLDVGVHIDAYYKPAPVQDLDYPGPATVRPCTCADGVAEVSVAARFMGRVVHL